MGDNVAERTTETGSSSLPPAFRARRLTPHTADVGIEVRATDLDALFEEAATAVGEIAADVEGCSPASVWDVITLDAGDLPGLAYAWLNELIGLCDIHHGALVAAHVDGLTVAPMPDGGTRWMLRARAGFRPFDGRGVRRRCEVKSATYHRLAIGREGDLWTLRAYVDL